MILFSPLLWVLAINFYFVILVSGFGLPYTFLIVYILDYSHQDPFNVLTLFFLNAYLKRTLGEGNLPPLVCSSNGCKSQKQVKNSQEPRNAF